MIAESQIVVDPAVAGEVIKLFKELDHGRGGSMGTWHGPRLKGCPFPWFETTYNRVVDAVAPLQIDQWWFNCGEKGDVYRWHSHFPYAQAAVLYVQVPERSGGIEFKDRGEFWHHDPEVGDLLVFSGALAHRVLPNQSEHYRISVAFNLLGRINKS